MVADSGSYDQATLQRRAKIAEAMLNSGTTPQKIEHWAQGLAQVSRAGMGGLMMKQAEDEAKALKAQDDAAMDLFLKGGSAAPSPQPAAPVNTGPIQGSPVPSPAVVQAMSPGATTPPVANARAEVMPSAKVWGDKEAEAAGLYEPSAKPLVRTAQAMGGNAPMPAPPPVIPAPLQAPAAAPVPSGGILAGATPQQRAAIAAGMKASPGSPARALAMSMMTSFAKPQDFDIHHRPDGSIIAVNKKNPSEVRTIAGDGGKGIIEFEGNKTRAIEGAKREGAVQFEAEKAGATKAAELKAAKDIAKPEQDKQDRKVADIVTQDIDRAIKTIDKGILPTTGATGNLVSNVGGTAAHDLSKLLDTVKSNAGFQELSKMRAASPTGAALGSVTERELALLQSTIGNLEQSQSEGQLKDNLKRVKNTYMDIIHGEGKGPSREKLTFQEKGKSVDPGALEEARRRGLIK